MKKLTVALLLGALALPAPVMAQQRPGSDHDGQHRGQGGPHQQGRPDQHGQSSSRPQPGRNDDRRPGQNGPSRPNPIPSNSHAAKPTANWQSFKNYDYNRPGAGGRKYFADRYYRDGANYKPSRITRNSRVYRGSNGRYYCRRSDGTTGLIVGVAIGGILGNRLGDGDSALLGTVLGAGIGGALGREIDRGNVQCK